MADTTKAAIQSAYLQLIEQKAADKITVKDIAQKCSINRNTFYYHYQDIYALMEDIVKVQAEYLVSRYPEQDSLRERVDFAVNEALAHKESLLHFYSSSNRSIFEDYLWKLCGRFVDSNVKDKREDRSFFVRYQKCFLFGLLIDWFNTGMPTQFLDDLHKAFDELNM